ncbi:uncharacterized protein LOC111596117 [Drosophila hydei]|uniref:Uncharacterized protein LOC111596117 n=1 Tax=Drosophila hydei TaxID=7224 RepID=A0A6J1LQJ7_DROHY|nr:uncharacterized protein LOC111596117 [Drosophila hydei]
MQHSIIFAVTLLALVALSNCILVKPTSVEAQLQSCSAPQTIRDLSNLRLLLVWYSADRPRNPVEYLRNILTDDLALLQLAFAINRVRVMPNQMIFDMSSSMSTHLVYRTYCKLFHKISEFRALGYNDPALPYEIRKTDLSFYD